jgi:hypothetical protein
MVMDIEVGILPLGAKEIRFTMVKGDFIVRRNCHVVDVS